MQSRGRRRIDEVGRLKLISAQREDHKKCRVVRKQVGQARYHY